MRKRKKTLTILIAIIFIFAIDIIQPNLIKNKNSKRININNNEYRRAMTYNQVTESDSNIDNCEYVKFSSFFIRDLDNDGYAERYDGTCNNIGKKASLYFDISVTDEGRLENGKISINGKNFYFSSTLLKDDVLKKDYIGNDVKELELNTISHGTQRLFFGTVNANIGNNINNYSTANNQIILTGTWISDDGTKTVNINKTVGLKIDWYGNTKTQAYQNNVIKTNHDIMTAVKADGLLLNFDVGYEEIAKELLIQKQITEITIPTLNGYDAISATVTSQNCTYDYDKESKVLTVSREAVIDDRGNILQSVSRYNSYSIQVKYPLEAYEKSEESSISITFPTRGKYYGYNNSSEEFSNENPYISSNEKDYTHTWSEAKGDEATFDIEIGKNVLNTDSNSYRNIISKKALLDTYNNIGKNEKDKDEYIVAWKGYTGNEIQDGMYMKEKQSDKFLNSSEIYTDMTNYIKTTGVYFSNLDGLLPEDGWIKVYDNETDELLLSVTKSECNDYTSSSPFKFEKTVKSIRVETSKINPNSYLYLYQIKEIDDDKITSEISLEEFEKINYIYSYVEGGKIENSIKTEINSTENYAYYEKQVSALKFNVSPTVISNQETKDMTMTITTETSYYNEAKWGNSIFVIEFPEQILDINLKSVTVDKDDTEISSYETYEENEKKFIKIYTNSIKDSDYKITVNADITADPREAATTKLIKLYAINKSCHSYKTTSSALDILDINGDGKTDENVLYKTNSLQIIAPTSLLTSQNLSDFDENGTKVVSPQIAILDKSNQSQNAQINQTITNNYSKTISEVKLIGKIPFKGNKYQINEMDMGSTYSVTMKAGGITLPNNIKEKAKVYYSSNEIVSTDLNDTKNEWKSSDEITDWANVKTYLIDLNDYILSPKESLVFSYGIEIPSNTKYNDITYSTHAVEFCFDTEDGKLKAKVESNKLGIMIAKKYTMKITKSKAGTDTRVEGATYKVTNDQMTKTGITDANGIINIEGLFIDKEYTVKEIQTPSSYILNNDEIKFKVTADDQENLKVNIISGSLKNDANITDIEGKCVLNIEVEDIAKYDIKILKSSQTGEKLKGIKFKLTGGIYGEVGKIFTTDSQSELSIINLIPNIKYKLQEIKADGYYINQNEISFTVSRDSNNQLVINSDDEEFQKATIVEKNNMNKAIVNVNTKSENIPTYSLKIKKQDKNRNSIRGNAI